MIKQIKILLVLFVIAIAAILYLIIASKPVNNLNGKDDKIQQAKTQQARQEVDLDQLKNDYKQKFKEVFDSYLSITQSTPFSIEEIYQIKNQLLDLKVPTEFKDLHIDFLFVITKMENFLETNNIVEKENSQELINKIKDNYNWLN